MKRLLLMVCCLAVTSAYAEEAEAPSTDLLEFMGEWEGSDGQWQDPMQLVNIDDADLRMSTQKSHEQESQNQESQNHSGTTPVSTVDDEVKHDEN